MTKQEKELIESSVNPFTTDLNIQVRVFKKIKRVVDTQDIVEGIVLANPDTITSSVLVEQEEYTKVFNRMAYRLNTMALTKEAKAVLLWFMYEVDPGKDYLWFNKTRYKAECGGSWTDINKGLAELCRFGYINKFDFIKDTYFINPRYFYQGNRLSKYANCLTHI